MEKRFLLSLFLCLYFSACTSIKSGRYITLSNNYSPKRLAKIFSVPEWKIREYNEGRQFKKGHRVFIPFKGGVVSGKNEYRKIASIDYQSMRSTSRFLWPVPSSKKISSGFGRRWGKKHEGIDIPGRKGAYIVASDDGVVVYSGKELGGYGNITVISHKGGFFTVYAHAHKNYTRKGQKVHRGQVIAALGSTGRSTGNHLHFEVRRDSYAFNPKKFFRRH